MHFIDCSVPPRVMKDAHIAASIHQIPGRVTERILWDPSKIGFHVEQNARGRSVLPGAEFRELLQGKPVLPANVLDFLLEHKELIPSEWQKRGHIVFAGTMYHYDPFPVPGRRRRPFCMRSMWYESFSRVRWRWDYLVFGTAGFGGANAALLIG